MCTHAAHGTRVRGCTHVCVHARGSWAAWPECLRGWLCRHVPHAVPRGPRRGRSSAAASLRFLTLLRPEALGPARRGTSPGACACVCTSVWTPEATRPQEPESARMGARALAGCRPVPGPCGWGLGEVDVRGRTRGCPAGGLRPHGSPVGRLRCGFSGLRGAPGSRGQRGPAPATHTEVREPSLQFWALNAEAAGTGGGL